ncbi:MAG: 2-oxoacid:acceptor oxidoreductase subunit alpha, partial [Elusimicrobia bacterium]|nr:2-oxoacid:acceptor oxidoreductase subunit alpha [Elusimicrobiota bacterium]
GDGIPYRTYPGNRHPLAAYFTRGSGHNESAQYTEDGLAYQRIVDRLLVKFETARAAMPAPEVDLVAGANVGIIAYGSTHQAIREARDILAADGMKTSYLKIRSYPFATGPVLDFIRGHKKVFLVEQNRDAQMAGLLKLDLGAPAAKIRSVLHYSGFPLPTEAVVSGILDKNAFTDENAPVILNGGE